MKLVVLDNVAAVIYPILGGGSFSESKLTLCMLGNSTFKKNSFNERVLFSTQNIC